ncbi:Importin beta family like protein [Aduncisulcus paluster]|uniref:Importin beta family like protein n=1 Tax=Aduncisulcus paluster TaxID=2918883 RepID=A0ABQ5KRG8_9EUKA|nr:Importin beta family like protein [Aduncisulcus paluster]
MDVPTILKVLNSPQDKRHSKMMAYHSKMLKENPMDALKMYFIGLELPQLNLRDLSCILFRRFMIGNHGSFLQDGSHPEIEDEIKRRLIDQVEKEPVPEVKKSIAGIISGVLMHKYSGVIKSKTKGWHEIIEKVLAWFDQADNRRAAIEIIESSVGTLIGQLESQRDKEKAIEMLFKTISRNLESETKPKAIARLTRCLLKVSTESVDEEKYGSVLKIAFNSLIRLFRSGELAKNLTPGETIIRCFVTTIMHHSSFVKPHLAFLHANLKDIAANTEIPTSLRVYALECEVVMCEQLPSAVRKAVPDIARDIIPLVSIFLGTEVRDDIDEWSRAVSKEDYSESTALCSAEDVADRLSQVLGATIVAPILLETCKLSVKSENWKYRTVAPELLSLCVEGIGRGESATVELVTELLSPIMHLHKDPHPRVRWCFAACMKRCVSDLSPVFCDTFADDVVALLVSMTKNDPCDRVKAAACSALVALVDEAGVDVAIPYMDSFIDAVVSNLRIDRLDTRSYGVHLLGKVAEYAEELITPHYHEFIDQLIVMLQKVTDDAIKLEGKEKHNNSRFRARLVSCVATLIGAVDKETVKGEHAQKVLDLFITSLKLMIDCGEDTVGESVMEGLSTLVKVFKGDLVPVVPRMMPILIKVALKDDEMKCEATPITQKVVETDDDNPDNVVTLGNFNYDFDSNAAEERAAALDVLSTLLEFAPRACVSDLKDIVKAGLGGMDSLLSDDAKQSAATILGRCVILAQRMFLRGEIDNSDLTELVSNVLKKIMHEIQAEEEVEVVCAYLHALCDVVYGIADNKEIVSHFQKNPEIMLEILVKPLKSMIAYIPQIVECALSYSTSSDDISSAIAHDTKEFFEEMSEAVQKTIAKEMKTGRLNLESTDGGVPAVVLKGLSHHDREELIDAVTLLQQRGEIVEQVLNAFSILFYYLFYTFGTPYLDVFHKEMSKTLELWSKGPLSPYEVLPTELATFVSLCIDILCIAGPNDKGTARKTNEFVEMGAVSFLDKELLPPLPDGSSGATAPLHATLAPVVKLTDSPTIINAFAEALFDGSIRLIETFPNNVDDLLNPVFGLSVLCERFPFIFEQKTSIMERVVFPLIKNTLQHKKQYIEPLRCKLTDNCTMLLLRLVLNVPALLPMCERFLGLNREGILVECVKRLPETRGDSVEANVLTSLVIDLVVKPALEGREVSEELIVNAVWGCASLAISKVRADVKGDIEIDEVLKDQVAKQVVEMCKEINAKNSGIWKKVEGKLGSEGMTKLQKAFKKFL